MTDTLETIAVKSDAIALQTIPLARKAGRRSDVDWAAVERSFRTGIDSLELIGKEYGVTKGRISQIAKRDGWTRDLNKKIKAKADARVNKAALNRELNAKTDRLAEKRIVEANADLQFKIRMQHRKDISRSRSLFQKLMDELEATTDNKDLFQMLGELLDESGPNKDGKWVADKQNELYRKVISMSTRVDSAKKLIEILEKTVKLEREAFGIDDNEHQDNPVDALLRKIYKERIGGA